MSFIKDFYIDIFGYYSFFMLFWTIFVPLILALVLFFIFRKPDKRAKSLELYNIIWKWEWKGNRILSLWCYCPVCGCALVCDDEYSRSNMMLTNKTTFFICKTCGDIEKSRVVGGDRNYVLKIVKREIIMRNGKL